MVDQVNDLDEEDVYSVLNQYLDLDATLWHLAIEIIFSDDDSYINKGGMDYYVYYDVYNERILPIEYDGNTVFGNATWSPFYHEDDVDFVLLNKLLSIQEIRQRYLAHFRTILMNAFDSDYIDGEIDQYADMIDSYVYDDPQKIYTYDDFINEINTLKDYFSNRSSYLWSNSEISESGVEILNVEYYVGSNLFVQPNSSEEVLVSVLVDEAESLPDVNLYYGTGLTGRFERVEMNYGFSSGIYTYSIPAQNSGEYVRFYVETITEDGSRKYNPEGAEHDVYIYQVKMDDLVYIDSDIVINEIMASNDVTVADEMGEFDDWVEIYNKGSVSINLNNYHLSDDISVLGKYTFPDVTLAPDEYFIVWADDDEEDQGDYNHATFNLSASGEELYLSDQNFNILDQLIFGQQETDMGYARVPNGTGNFIIQDPTFSANNEFTSSDIEIINPVKHLVKTVDILGREGTQLGFLIDCFDDGSYIKKYVIE